MQVFLSYFIVEHIEYLNHIVPELVQTRLIHKVFDLLLHFGILLIGFFLFFLLLAFYFLLLGFDQLSDEYKQFLNFLFIPQFDLNVVDQLVVLLFVLAVEHRAEFA